MNAVGSKLYHTVAYSRGEVAVLVGLIGTDKTSDMRTRPDRALVTDVYTAAVVKTKHQSICAIQPVQDLPGTTP